MQTGKNTFLTTTYSMEKEGLNNNIIKNNFQTFKSPEFSAKKLYNIISNSSLSSLQTCKTISSISNPDLQGKDNKNKNTSNKTGSQFKKENICEYKLKRKNRKLSVRKNIDQCKFRNEKQNCELKFSKKSSLDYDKRKFIKNDFDRFYNKKMNQMKLKNLKLERERDKIIKEKYDVESKIIEQAKGRKVTCASVNQIVNRLYNTNQILKEKVNNLKKCQEQKRKDEFKSYFHPVLETQNYFGTYNCKIAEEEKTFKNQNEEFKNVEPKNSFQKNVISKITAKDQIDKKKSVASSVRKSESMKSISEARVSSACTQLSSYKNEKSDALLFVDSTKNRIRSKMIFNEHNFNAIDLCFLI